MTYLDSDVTEELLMNAAGGDLEAVKKLSECLGAAEPRAMTEWPPGPREEWEAGLELVLDALDLGQLGDDQIQFALNLAEAGYDTMPSRDLLAAAARITFGHYPDPAGLLVAIGITVASWDMRSVRRRWSVFDLLAEGIEVYHSAHGWGTIEEIDGITNEVYVGFGRSLHLPLDVFLSSVCLPKRGTPFSEVLAGDRPPRELLETGDVVAAVGKELASSTPPDADLIRRILVPRLLSEDDLRSEHHSKKAPSPAGTPVPRPSSRRWDQSRSLAEMVGLLERQSADPAEPAELDNVLRLLQGSLSREDFAPHFCSALSLLWAGVGDQQWLCDLLLGCADACCWVDPALFVRLTDRMASKSVPPWLAATQAAKGSDFLADRCLEFPLRLWTHVEKSLGGTDAACEHLMPRVLARIAAGDVPADILMWLWRVRGDQASELADAQLIFRTLARLARGSFTKARKDLRKALLENAGFQRVVVCGGDPTAIQDLVRCIRHVTLLDSGEQQSLLVRIVRQFPEARALVEDRTREAPSRRPIANVTSARSFELRRRELHDIINVRVPANTRAMAHARAYGDLRENAEYKAAKEEQGLLSTRRNELEEALHDVRPTDFSDVVLTSGEAVPGCTVGIAYDGGDTGVYHLLGMWDSVPERSMVSFDTPVGELLLGAQIGDELTFPNGKTGTVTRVDALTEELHEWLLGHDLEPEEAPD